MTKGRGISTMHGAPPLESSHMLTLKGEADRKNTHYPRRKEAKLEANS
jgi:hypothetical protein